MGKFDPTTLHEIRFVFDASEKGAVLLDDLGVTPGPPTQWAEEGEIVLPGA